VNTVFVFIFRDLWFCFFFSCLFIFFVFIYHLLVFLFFPYCFSYFDYRFAAVEHDQVGGGGTAFGFVGPATPSASRHAPGFHGSRRGRRGWPARRRWSRSDTLDARRSPINVTRPNVQLRYRIGDRPVIFVDLLAIPDQAGDVEPVEIPLLELRQKFHEVAGAVVILAAPLVAEIEQALGDQLISNLPSASACLEIG